MSIEDEPAQPRRWRDVARGYPWYAKPIYALAWLAAFVAYELYRSPFLGLAKLLAVFALPLGALTYCWEAKDRHREHVYHSWEVVAKAEGTEGNPARYEALQDLAEIGVALAKVNLAGAFLENIDLRGVDLRFADLRGAHLAEARLGCRGFWYDVRCTNLRWAKLMGADLAWADLSGANLSRARVDGVDFTCADLRGAVLTGLSSWKEAVWTGSDLRGVEGVPPNLNRELGDSVELDARPMDAAQRTACRAGRLAAPRPADTVSP